MKKFLLSVLFKLGYQLHKRNSDMELSNSTMPYALQRLRDNGVSPARIIDGGAAKGVWTKLCKRYFPEASYFLVEPLSEQISQIDPGVVGKNDHVINAVLGAESGHIDFNVSADLDGSGIYGNSANKRSVRMVPLAELIGDGRALIKLDTHGYEIPILEGVGNSWEYVDALIIEVYTFKVSPTARFFHEIVAYLSQKGYRLFDIVDLARRSKDGALWQADAVFLKSNNPVFNSESYD